MATPDPTQVAPWYLRNINQALALNEATGNVYIRTDAQLTIGNVGNVNVTNVEIKKLGNVDISGNTLPVSGNVTVAQGTTPWNITGTVGITGNVAGITALPPITGNVNANITGGNVNAAVTGTVAVSSITGNIAGITALPPITGNVNANITGGNVTVAQGTTPWTVDGSVDVATLPPITGNVNANITGGTFSTTITGTNLDAFGRLRVSEPYTLFDSQNLYVDGGQFSNITAVGGTVTYVQAQSSFNLSVTGSSGSSVITQARTTQAYQPGKSLLVMNTFAMATLSAGCRQRVGYFTNNNGIYFEADGTDLFLVIRSSASGAIVEERIAQTNWNGDTLSGASPNPSGITLDPTLTQIFWSDIEWLGVGNVRAGFIINGQYIVCHTFQHANQSGNTTVYMTTATLNPRYEITNTAATAGPRTMKQICSTVISEGGYNPSTSINYVSGGIQPTRISAANTYISLATIRLNPATPDAVVTPAQVDLLLTDVKYGAFQLVLNASNAAGLTYSNVGSGIVQANVSTVTVGDGQVVYAGLTSSRDTLIIGEDIQRRLQLSRSVDGSTDTLTLCVGYGTTNADVIWKFGWQEVTN